METDSAPVQPDNGPSTEVDDDMTMDNEEEVKDATSIPLKLYGYSSRDTDAEADHKCLSTNPGSADNTPGPLPLLSRSENLCVRHQRMADEGANARLQKVRYILASRLVIKCMYPWSNCLIPHSLLPWPV